MSSLNVCVFVVVCVQMSSSPASLQLLSILQTLLVLGPERSDIWLALEAITNRAIMLAQDCESALKQQCIHSRTVWTELWLVCELGLFVRVLVCSSSDGVL